MNEKDIRADEKIQAYITQNLHIPISDDYDSYIDQQIWKAKHTRKRRRRYLSMAAMVVLVICVGTLIKNVSAPSQSSKKDLQETSGSSIHGQKRLTDNSSEQKEDMSIETGKDFLQGRLTRIFQLKGEVAISVEKDQQATNGKDQDRVTTYLAQCNEKQFEARLNRSTGKLMEIKYLNADPTADIPLDESLCIAKMYQQKEVADSFCAGGAVEEWALRYDIKNSATDQDMLQDGLIYCIFRTDENMLEICYDLSNDSVTSIVTFDDYKSYKTEHASSYFLGIDNGY